MAAKQAPQVRPVERVQTSFKQLSLAANTLNAASDELGKSISAFESSLKTLNLGISAWVTLSSGQNEHCPEYWWRREVGYTKIGNHWGIALRSSSGDYTAPDDDSVETWSFNDAPRWMRAEAAGKLPELLETLVKQAQETTKLIEKKTAQVRELTEAITSVREETSEEQ